MFCATVMFGYSALLWKTIAMSRSLLGSQVTSRPPMEMLPAVGVSRPAIILSSVLLPQPEAPTRIKNSPASISMSMPLRMRTLPA